MSETGSDTHVSTPPAPRQASSSTALSGARAARWGLWVPGLVVALGAAVATAHGLFEVTVAARVPAAVAWLYPLITDGLALVAYAATTRLAGRAAHYAWSVVITAAGLSGLAQAAYLAATPIAAGAVTAGAVTADAVTAAPPALVRFGIGAWPAIAAAIAAHLLYLLTTSPTPVARATDAGLDTWSETGPYNAPSTGPNTPVNTRLDTGMNTGLDTGDRAAADTTDVQPTALTTPAVPHTAGADAEPATTSRPRELPSPASDRATHAAMRHAQRRGAWPTVRELEAAAEVSRGTAAAALRALRDQPLPLHVITNDQNEDIDDHPNHDQ